MNTNEEIICDQCRAIFHGSGEVQIPIKHCPRCIEKSQDETLRIIFGETEAKD